MTDYAQNELAGEDKDPNCLPASKGPLAAAMRASIDNPGRRSTLS
jgi:hypothetical protein